MLCCITLFSCILLLLIFGCCLFLSVFILCHMGFLCVSYSWSILLTPPLLFFVFFPLPVSSNSFTSYAYMSSQHLKEPSLSGLRWRRCMLFFHGFLWAIFLNRHWFVPFGFLVVANEGIIVDLLHVYSLILTVFYSINFEWLWNSLSFSILQLETLLKFFYLLAYRNLTLQCLTEVSLFLLSSTWDFFYLLVFSPL